MTSTNNASRIKLSRVCAGAYVTKNLAPHVRMEKSVDGDGWFYSFSAPDGDGYGLWSSLKELRSLFEDVANHEDTFQGVSFNWIS